MLNLILILLATNFVHASYPLLTPGETVSPVHLLEIEDQPGHFIFVGQRTGQWHAFEVHGGVAREVPMTTGLVMYDGQSLNFSLEGYRRLFVPSDRSDNYYGGRRVPYLIHPDRARERLIPREFTRESLAAHGLASWLSPEETYAPRAEWLAPAIPADAILLIVTTARENAYEACRRLADALKAELPAHEGRGLVLNDGNRLAERTTLLLVPPDRVREISQRARALGAESVVAVADGARVMRPDSSVTTAAALARLKDHEGPLTRRLAALATVASRPEAWVEHLDRGEGFFEVWSGLGALGDVITALSEQIAQIERARLLREDPTLDIWSARDYPRVRERVGQTDAFRRLVEPLRAAHARVSRAILSVGRRDATRLVLMNAAGGGPRSLRLLDEPVPGSSGTATDEWFAWQLERLRSTDDLPALASEAEVREDWSLIRAGVGGFRELGLSGNPVDVVRRSEEAADRLSGHAERVPALPFWRLGMSEDVRDLRRRIVTHVITADQRAGASLPRLNENLRFQAFANSIRAVGPGLEAARRYWLGQGLSAEDHEALRFPWQDGIPTEKMPAFLDSMRRHAFETEPYDGSGALIMFLQKLGYTERAFADVPGFDAQRYAGRVAEIVIELIEDAEDYLVTRGTYLTLLDLALQLIKAKATDETFARRQRELDSVVRRRLVAALPAIAKKDGGCGELLGPDPNGYRAWRDQKEP